MAKQSSFALKTLAVAAAMGFMGSVSAQGFPDKPLTLVVPFAAGGPTDVSARLYGKALEKHLGQPVVIENKAGEGRHLGQHVRGACQGRWLHPAVGWHQHIGCGA